MLGTVPGTWLSAIPIKGLSVLYKLVKIETLWKAWQGGKEEREKGGISRELQKLYLIYFS